jgi:cell division protein FtsI/penicillin-binding protein 2
MAGNGLGAIEATPMQVTRAILALARGEYLSLRLVREVGGVEIAPAEKRRLGVGDDVLLRIRKALRGVVNEVGGTARSTLGPKALGLDICAKTGSADIASSGEDGSRIVRKHTWVAGWIPAENPLAVFCIFEHDTQATSSHGAVYLARQFLRQPEVLNWLSERGVDVSRAEQP